MMSTEVVWPLTIFYDASCPLCREEMHMLKARDDSDRLRLVDCSAAGFTESPEAACGITRDAMMARIHALDAKGRWWVGVDVFAAAYRAAGLSAVARIYESPRLRPLFDRIYPWIADHRRGLSLFGLPRLFHIGRTFRR